MLRFSIQQAEQDGIERSADSVLAALLASQGFEDISPDLVRRATDRHFALEGDLRAPATGAAALLAELKRRLSGRHSVQHHRRALGAALDRWHGFRPYVDTVVVSDEIGIRKPRPESSWRPSIA